MSELLGLNQIVLSSQFTHPNTTKYLTISLLTSWGGGGGGSSVGRAHDSWLGGPGFDSRSDSPLPTGWVGVSMMWQAETEVMVSQLCLVCGST